MIVMHLAVLRVIDNYGSLFQLTAFNHNILYETLHSQCEDNTEQRGM